jgi:catechol 2,3-dioxygenase-like lactoylglutathione lyase family enzyme
MHFAKPHLDVGIFTNNLEPMLEFWQQEVELPFESLLPTGGGNRQHRHIMNGSIFKLNHVRDPLPEVTPAGYHHLIVAHGDSVRELTDPDGNRVTLVPKGHDGVIGIAMRMRVRSLPKAEQYYGGALQFESLGAGKFRFGNSLLWLEEDASQPPVGEMRGTGYRYLTAQVFDVDAEHAAVLERGGQEGEPPRTLGETARISFVRDPDGNWLEISQRASLTGPLEKA